MCSGFAQRSDKLKTWFEDKLVLLPTNFNIDITLSPSDKKPKPIPRLDPTIEIAKAEQLREMSFVGQVICNRLCSQFYYINVN